MSESQDPNSPTMPAAATWRDSPLWNYQRLIGDEHLSPQRAEARRIDHEIAQGRLVVSMAYRDRHGLLRQCAHHEPSGDDVHLEGEGDRRYVEAWFIDDLEAECNFRNLIIADREGLSDREARRLFLADPYQTPTRPHVDLSTFSGALADRLDGTWEVLRDSEFADSPNRAMVTGTLWDDALVEGVLQDVVQREAALLVGPGDEALLILARPRHPDQVLVAALAPPGVDGVIRSDHVPRGIAVSSDPARAAAAVSQRLLPRYHACLDQVRMPVLGHAHREAARALADWDAVSGSLTDDQGFPIDGSAYGARQAERDMRAWDAFEAFLVHGPTALHTARTTLDRLTPPPETASRWHHDLRALNDAVREGIQIRDKWATRLSGVADDAGRQRALEARAAEGWSAVDAFIRHGPVLRDIALAQRDPMTGETRRIVAARAHSTAAVISPHRAPRADAPFPLPPAAPQNPRRQR
ncbi:hypothetical protein ABZ832_12385 [Streptantibioticus parmotrematis]|uniref:hypothetical protein n=1 Tax=Streptantibioticus parmotrematis TaxID=2873249 RepID=UPI0033EAB219